MSLAAVAAIPLAAAALAAPPACPRVTPFADCVVPPQPPAIAAKAYFGYSNPGAQRTIVFGDDNQVVPGLGFQGQPQVFNSGTYERVFAAVWNTQAFLGIQWNLDGIGGLANATTPPCVAGATGPLSDLTPTSATLNGLRGHRRAADDLPLRGGAAAATPDVSSAGDARPQLGEERSAWVIGGLRAGRLPLSPRRGGRRRRHHRRDAHLHDAGARRSLRSISR